MVPRIRYKLTSPCGQPIAEPAEKVDPRTDCGHEWTQLTSKPVRRMQVLITGCMFFGGMGLLSIVRFLPWSDLNARAVLFVISLLWGLLTGIGFMASLMLWLAPEPDVSLSRPYVRGGEPIALRWRLPEGFKKRTLKIEFCGQEEWTRVFRGDTRAEIFRFLTLALVDVPESLDQQDGTVCFRPPPLKPSFKEQRKDGSYKIRYWINVRSTPAILSSFDYEVTVQD